ncbi:MAG: bacillithiol biosynthesis cysteine-adding enzyme BshC [bacterium]
MRSLIQPTRAMGYSDLYLDFLCGRAPARDFYRVTNLSDAAANLDAVDFPRGAMASILRSQNVTYGADEQALANIDALESDPRSVCVFTGQQAVLFGGPMLVMHKALGIAKAARLYSKQLRRTVIPVFWIAADDHDFEEANHTWLLDRQTQPVRLAYQAPPDKEVSTSQIFFDNKDELQRVKTLLSDTLGQTDFTPDLHDLIEQAYTSEDSFASAFGKLMAALTRNTGLVLFSPGDREVKRLAVPFFTRLVEAQEELHTRLTRSNNAIVEAGYHLQVEKSDDSAHLFCNCDGRSPVKRINGSFRVGDLTLTEAELLDKIETEPWLFSPDVITRPILQSWLFPVLSQKGGPAEIAYLAQNNDIFSLFDRMPPHYMARPSVTVMEGRIARLVHDHHIMFRELTGDIEQIVNRVLMQTFPGDIEKGLALLRQDISFHLDKFATESLPFDKGLQGFADQTSGKIDYLLGQFEHKVFAAHKKKSNDTRERIYRVANALYTNRGLQERSLNVAYFISRYGPDFLSYLYRETESEEKSHQLLDMTGYAS